MGYKGPYSRAALAALIACLLPVISCGRPAPSTQAPPPAPDAAAAPPAMTPIKAGPGEVPAAALVQDKSRPRVTLRRNKDGTYSWEVSGDDVDKILDADRKLSRAAERRKTVSGGS